MAVVRAFRDSKAIVALLNAGHAVVVVLRTSEDERRRVLDLLTGWALGADGELDRIGPNTLVALPHGIAPLRIGRTALVSAVEEAFAADTPEPLGRDEEERILPLAVAGSRSARRKLIDAYTEFATLFALQVRPRSVPEKTAVRVAQDELERLVSFPSQGPLLASLAKGISELLAG